MPEESNAFQALMLKAAQDESFRRELLADPKPAIESFLGAKLPDALNVKVVENTPTEITLAIPPLMSSELSDEDLDAVSGGFGGLLLITGSLGLIGVTGGITAVAGGIAAVAGGIARH